jgi:hypothetical protein
MSTSDILNFDEAAQKLQAIIQFSSFFSNSIPEQIYDKILLDDPFKKANLMKRVPKNFVTPLNQLIEKFESSLQRILVSFWLILSGAL